MAHLLRGIALTITMAAPAAASADWTGSYLGLTYGDTSNGTFEWEFESGTEIADSEYIGGFWASMTQQGTLVLGREIAVGKAEDAVLADGINDFAIEEAIWDFKYRVGYAIDNVQPYATFGTSYVPIDAPGADLFGLGLGFGVGVDVLVSDRALVGIEYLSRKTWGEAETSSGFSVGDYDLDLDTLTFRAAVKF